MADDASRWEGRQGIARAIRIFVAVAPIAVSVVIVSLAGRFLPRPDGLIATVAWWIALTALATLVLWLADRLLRRLLPLVALFRLSLVFPDRAPSRFKTALRSGTVAQLRRQVTSGEFSRATPQEAAEQLIVLAGTLNAHDRLTRGHTERVRAYAAMIGQEMGLEGEDLELLNWSGLVHDIGKLAVPTEILNKPGKPSDEEWKILRDHPAQADALVEPLRPWLGQWAESATQHHERYDGNGYPNGLAGRDISLAGRIVAVADAYDVMTSTRSYKKPMPTAEARSELARNAGTQFDPEVVRAFLNIAIGHLRLVMGPLSSLAQFPAGSASLGSSAVTGASAVASVAIAAVSGLIGGPSQPIEPIPETVAFVEYEAVDIDVDGSEDTSLEVDLAALLSGKILTIELIADPQHGTAVVSPSGVVTFHPDPDFHGRVELSYVVCFDDGSCDTGVIVIQVRDINDPPVAVPDIVGIAEDTVADVDVLDNDVDADGDPLTVVDAQVVDDPDFALHEADIRIENGRVRVEPPADASGSILVEYTIVDLEGEPASATLVVHVDPVDDAPIARNDGFKVYENTAAALNVLANDSDVDGDVLRIIALGSVSGGVATIDGGMVRFVPDLRYIGPAGFDYTMSDGITAVTAAVDIVVVDVTDKPLVGADTAVVGEDQVATVDVLANDIAHDSTPNPATVALTRPPTHGTAVWSGVDFEYTPEPDWWGDDSFDYLVCDLRWFCNKATVTIIVTPVNDAPGFTAGPGLSVSEDAGPRTIPAWATAITTGPTDETAQTLTFNVTAANPGLFTTQPAIDPTGQLTYTAGPDLNGTTTLTITATDDGGGTDTSPPATVTLTITPVNDAPGFTAGPDPSASEDAGPQTIPAWATAITTGPTDETAQTLTFNVTAANPGLFTTQPAIDPTGQLTYTAGPDLNGTTTLTITATDDGGGTDASPPATVTLTVTPVNDAPVGFDDVASVDEDDLGGVTFDVLPNDTDIDGDTVLYGSADTSTVVNGSIVDNADGTFTYVPSEHYNGTETFSYTAIDGNGGSTTATVVTITVVAQPDAPVAANIARATLIDTPLVVPAPGVLINDYDVDGETLTVNTTPVTPPSNGSVGLAADGSYTYTPGAGYVGTDSFVYEISDPGGLTSTATVTITVDNGVANQTFFLGDSGAAAWHYNLIGAAPISSTPVFDSDGDGSPGLTIDNSNGDPLESDPTKFQLWSTTVGAPLDLNGPVTLDLWASVKDFDVDKNAHPHVFLYDCLGLSCVLLAQTSVHFDDWNQGTANFVNRQLDLGSVTHIVNPGRDLVLRLQFGHEDMWTAMTADYPSSLVVTLSNQPPAAADDAVTIDEDDPTTNIAVLANDVDADIDTASVTVTSPAGAGTATPVGDGTIDYTPDLDANGVDSFEYQVCDLGGNCDTATVTVTVTAVNDEPTFIGGGSVVGGLGANTFIGWATAIGPGPADELSQILNFVVTLNDNPGMFTTGPAIDSTTGTLTFDAALSGLANLTLELRDNGGTANGGDDVSPSYSFTINVP